jgi:hypothetical protein
MIRGNYVMEVMIVVYLNGKLTVRGIHLTLKAYSHSYPAGLQGQVLYYPPRLTPICTLQAYSSSKQAPISYTRNSRSLKCEYIMKHLNHITRPRLFLIPISGHTPAARVRRMKIHHDEQQEVRLRDRMWPIKIQQKVPCRTGAKDSRRNAESQGADPGSRSSSCHYSSRRRKYARVLVLEDQEIEPSPYLPLLSSKPPYNFLFPGLVLIPSQVTNAASQLQGVFSRVSLACHRTTDH